MGKQARLQEEYEFDETLLTQFGIRLEAAGMRIGYKSFPRQGPWPCPAGLAASKSVRGPPTRRVTPRSHKRHIARNTWKHTPGHTLGLTLR